MKYYQALLSNYNPGLALSPAAKQIELDLLRTMPNNVYYENNHSKGEQNCSCEVLSSFKYTFVLQ